jgi:hypothetical protein
MSFEIVRELLQTASVEGVLGSETRLFLIMYPAGADRQWPFASCSGHWVCAGRHDGVGVR